MISAVITNFNQGDLLKDCLKSALSLADELVVIDLGSDDQSVKVCQQYHARVIHHKVVPFVELIRNYSVEQTRGDWILILDPDERINQILVNKLKEIASENKYQAVDIPRKNIFFGRWIKHTNWWPDRHVRFFRKGKVIWSDKIHLYPKVNGEILELPAREELAIQHFGYSNFSQLLERQNRYSSVEAQNRYSAGEQFTLMKMFWLPLREFLVRFIKHQGYLDGFYGFALTFFMMVYQLMVAIKLWELNSHKK